MATEVAQIPAEETPAVAASTENAEQADKPAAATEAAPAAAAPAEKEGAGDAAQDKDNKEEKADGAAGDGEAKKEEATAVAKTDAPPPAQKFNVHKANFEKDIIYLYQFSRTPLLPSLSPYCLKVETWLRLVGLKYEVSFKLRILDSEPPEFFLG